MKKYLLGAALLVSLNAFATGNELLEGAYECKGHELGTNEAFSCKMNISKTGDTYASTAECSDGNSYRGTGIYDKNSKQLSTVFINPKKPEETGVCVATIKADGQLASEWTYLDKTSIASTTCQKSS